MCSQLSHDDITEFLFLILCEYENEQLCFRFRFTSNDSQQRTAMWCGVICFDDGRNYELISRKCSGTVSTTLFAVLAKFWISNRLVGLFCWRFFGFSRKQINFAALFFSRFCFSLLIALIQHSSFMMFEYFSSLFCVTSCGVWIICH